MIQREQYMTRIRPFINQELIKVLTGIRRSGKSVMLELIQQELLTQGAQPSQFIGYNFENMKHRQLLNAEALHQAVEAQIQQIEGRAYLFFDEIQEVTNWEKCVNSLRVTYDCDIYITGSNAKLLSGELATYLSGRYVEFVIYPFSFQEFWDLYRQSNPDSTENNAFQQYLLLGGMPYLNNLRYEPQPCQIYLQDLYNSVVLKDVVKRNNIRDVDLLERIIAYVVANVGNTFSATAISKYFKSEQRTVAPDTILNYIKACEEAFLFYRVKREDIQGKKILAVNEKYYMADQGMREAVFGGNLKDVNLILENIVYMELLRRGYQITVGKMGNKEVDFVAQKQDKRLYVQVCYLLASPETVEREFSAFNGIPDHYPKLVLSLDELDMSQNGITHLNLRRFLLGQV
ncbi:ATP-binding protein [Bengtsoniella intestinalis]|uniref:ATP-binding protein n=1 Tax=Bengtsoniella intestinalis TaxID=3073143 RepID=UPI00391FC44F